MTMSATKTSTGFEKYLGKLIRIHTMHKDSYFGVLSSIENGILNLSPHIRANLQTGDYEETNDSLTLKLQDVLTPQPIGEDSYKSLTNPHPWKEYVGNNIIVQTKTGKDYIGTLESITNGWMHLNPHMQHHPTDGPIVVDRAMHIKLDDINVPIPLEYNPFEEYSKLHSAQNPSQ